MKYIANLGFPFHHSTNYDSKKRYHVFSLDDVEGFEFPEDLDKTKAELHWWVESTDSRGEVKGHCGVLWCGGHYTCVRIYDGDVDITDEFFDPDNKGDIPDPNAQLFDRDSIHDYCVDKFDDVTEVEEAKIEAFMKEPRIENLHLLD